jgi:hypothetical protein
MSEDSALEFGSLMAKIVIVVSLFSVPALAQQATSTPLSAEPHASTLPDAPSSQDPQDGSPLREETPAVPATSSALQGPIGPVPPLWTNTPLTFKEKFTIYTHQAFGPPALVFPALGAGIRMASPPKNYPRDWIDGGGAFARLYGSALATQTSKRTAKFLADSMFHEDPRYLPAPEGATVGGRFVHAVAFTFVDRSDSGKPELAFGNFASAAAGGFVGMAYLPNGFNDVSHAGQRMATEFLGIAIANISREFAPQWVPVARKLHIPKIVPSWWAPERLQP